jgi:hypothetical protein
MSTTPTAPVRIAILGAPGSPAVADYRKAALDRGMTVGGVWTYPSPDALFAADRNIDLLVLADAHPDAAAIVDAALDRDMHILTERPFVWDTARSIDLYAKSLVRRRVLRVGLPSRLAVNFMMPVVDATGPYIIQARRVVAARGARPTAEELLLDDTGIERIAQALSYFPHADRATAVAPITRGGDAVCLSMVLSDGGQLVLVTERGERPRDELRIIAGETVATFDLSVPLGESKVTVTGSAEGRTVPSLAACRDMLVGSTLRAIAADLVEIPREDVRLTRTVNVARGSLLLAGSSDAIISYSM